jgi:hypothetical protein
MIPQPSPIPFLYDELLNFTLGVDSAKSPDLVAPGYSAFAVNATFRNGKPRNRPAFRELVIPDQEHKLTFQNGRHQGETIYQNLTTNDHYMVAVRGGWVLRIDLDTKLITLLNPGDQNDPTRRHYFAQADKYLIIQNGVDIPLIWDGITIRRSRCTENNPGVTNVSISHIAGIATVTTSAPHGLVVGDFVAIDGELDPIGYIGNYRVGEVPTPTTYKIRVTSTLATPATLPGITYRPMEVPIGTFMEYAMGRLCVVTPDRREMRIGDLIRTAPDTSSEESVLWFTEELFLAESFKFSLPTQLGRIRAVVAIPYMGAPTGQGDLLISGDRGLSTLSLSYPRNEWLDRPIQKIALTGIAIASQEGLAGWNGDVVFRDLEYGIRTFRLADAEFQKTPAQTPISSEMNRIFLADEEDKLQFSSVEVFHNRLLCTATPVFDQRAIAVSHISVAADVATITLAEPALHTVGTIVRLIGTTAPEGVDFTVTAVNSDVSIDIDITGQTVTDQEAAGFIRSQETGTEYYHRGIAALDYTSISGAWGNTQIAWDGVWTGLNVQTIRKAVVDDRQRVFLSVYNDVLFRNEIWEITTEEGPDVGEFVTGYPPAWVELSAQDCKKPFSKKRLLGLNLWLSGIRGNIEGRVYYRHDNDSCWTPWAMREELDEPQFELCANTAQAGDETNPTDSGTIVNLPQRRTVRIGQPLFECNQQTTEDGRLFYTTQLKIQWIGQMTIDRLQLAATEEIEDMRGGCR